MISYLEQIYLLIAQIMMITGVFFCITAAIGLVRMPDFFTKIHAIGLSDNFGIPLILLSLIMMQGFTVVAAKLVLLILVIYIFGPTVTLELGNYFVNISQNESDHD